MSGVVCVVCPFADVEKLKNIHVDLALLVWGPALLSTRSVVSLFGFHTLCHWAARACPWLSTALVAGPIEEEKEGICIASEVDKVEGPAPPGCLREDRVRRYVGDFQSWVRTPWLAGEETPGPKRFPIIDWIKQIDTQTLCLYAVSHDSCVLLCFINPILGNHYGPGVSSCQQTSDNNLGVAGHVD
jgi:hypothetical protein